MECSTASMRLSQGFKLHAISCFTRSHCGCTTISTSKVMHTLHRQCMPAGLHKGPALHTAFAFRCIQPSHTCLAAYRDSEQASVKQQLGIAAANAVLATSLLLAPQAALANEVKVGADPVYDGAGVLMADARDNLSKQLLDLEQRTGYHVRVFTQYYIDASPEAPNPRGLWGSLDNQTVVVRVDPSSPNILSVPYVGDNVLAKLRRPFWTELESRFGNMFYVREAGDSAAVLGAMSALVECLDRPEGCRVVPGLPPEQYVFTLWCAIAGGLVVGFVNKIEPQGMVKRKWVWLLLFSPLWGSLFINFGLGPIVSRTSDLAPIAGNMLGFLAAASAPGLLQRLWDGEQPPVKDS